MARTAGWAGFGWTLGAAALLAGVSTAALAEPGTGQDPRDARIQQLQDQVQQLIADHRRLQAEDDQLVAKAQQLEAEVDALKQGQAAQAIQSQSQTIETVEAKEPPPAAAPKPDDGSLTWHGITIYGTYDVGVGWVSHGLPENGYNYEGESLVNRNGNHSQFLIAPNNLSQTGLGIRGKEELAAWLVCRVQRFDRHQSAVRPACQPGGHQHQQRRPPEEQLFVRRRRRARRPGLQRRTLCRHIVHASSAR